MTLPNLCQVSVGRRYADSRAPQRLRLQAANSSETIGSKDGARASSDVGGWGPERSRASQAESELGSIVSAPDMYPEDSDLVEELVVCVMLFPGFTSSQCYHQSLVHHVMFYHDDA